jgi:hypothetical protein
MRPVTEPALAVALPGSQCVGGRGVHATATDILDTAGKGVYMHPQFNVDFIRHFRRSKVIPCFGDEKSAMS